MNIKSHRGIRKNGRNAVTACVIAAAIATCAAPDPARYNVIWDSPSADCHGSMPLGNGEIGLNVWTLADGSLHLLISKTDAWDEHGRLVKVGEVVVRFDPAVFKGAFRQELDLKTGSIVIQDKIRVWVDAHHPVVRVTTDLPAQADLALWRTNRIELTQLQTSDIMNGAPAALRKPVVIEPDVLVEKNDQQITWYHHNVHSGGPALLAQIQGLAEYAQLDPLADRIFGARLVKRAQGFDIVVLTQQPSTASRWLETLTRLAEQARTPDFAAHCRWWADHAARSWLCATRNEAAESAHNALYPANDHPLRIGADQTGHNRFAGEMRNVSVTTNAHGAITFVAEVRPATGETGRLFDQLTPGKQDGFLIDTYPGNSLRLISGSIHQVIKDVLPGGVWARVEAVADAQAGGWRVAINHTNVIDSTETQVSDEADYVSRMVALQRFITTCAGRGSFPIKFNGSLFTVAPDAAGDHDFRRWGPGYWWQNTRLPYIGMCAWGDTEQMKPLFAMYIDALLPFCTYRTKKYCGHAGAFYPECVYFWGPMFSETYGWTPFEQRTDKLQENRYHKWEWVGGLELCALALDYYEHTQERSFFEQKVLPLCREILTFFDQHYTTGSDGKLVMYPSQSCETWWVCTNALPEIAGCYAVTEQLLALRETPQSERPFLHQLRAKLPPLPLREVAGKTMLAPAATWAEKRNSENPELYAVYPFRLVSFEKDNRALGIEALTHCTDKGAFGWRQDDLFMAYLGLAEEARKAVVSRAKRFDKKERFPAFWGPNYDWTPDQDHGGVLVKAVQSMVMQTEGRKIYLLPAWPRGWDCDFQLHAPLKTVVRGTVKNGKLVSWETDPAARKADVVLVRE